MSTLQEWLVAAAQISPQRANLPPALAAARSSTDVCVPETRTQRFRVADG
jgi:hypothetical protein